MQKHLNINDVTHRQIHYGGGYITLAIVNNATQKRCGIAVIQDKDVVRGAFNADLGNTIAEGRATLKTKTSGQYDLSALDLSRAGLKRIVTEAKKQEYQNFGNTVKYRALLQASKSL